MLIRVMQKIEQVTKSYSKSPLKNSNAIYVNTNREKRSINKQTSKEYEAEDLTQYDRRRPNNTDKLGSILKNSKSSKNINKSTNNNRIPHIITVDIRKSNRDFDYKAEHENPPMIFASKPKVEPDYILLVNKSPRKDKFIGNNGTQTYDSNQDYIMHRRSHYDRGMVEPLDKSLKKPSR